MSENAPQPDFVMNPGEKTTMLFMQMVFQLSSLATMLLGKAPHPDTGKTQRDLESAQVVIDQLAMLEAKTKGNLSREEEQMLKQTLMGLRMAYVEAVTPSDSGQPEAEKTAPPSQSSEGASPEAPEAPEEASVPEEESRKRFTKKY